MDAERFVDRLRADTIAYRAGNGLTQEEMADLIGVNQGMISSFEKGTKFFREENFNRLIALVRGEKARLSAELRQISRDIDCLRDEDVFDVAEISGRLGRIAESFRQAMASNYSRK